MNYVSIHILEYRWAIGCYITEIWSSDYLKLILSAFQLSGFFLSNCKESLSWNILIDYKGYRISGGMQM